MKFARRNRSLRERTSQARGQIARGFRHTPELFESLESRVLLTGETVVVNWHGTLLEVAKNQYIMNANAPSADVMKWTLNHTGLDVADVQKLADNTWLVVDSADSLAQVGLWGEAYVGFATVSPNEVYHKAGTTVPNEASTPYGSQLITQSLQKIGLIPANYDAASGLPITSGTSAWDLTTGNQNVVIAIMDTGIDTASADLAGNLWTNPLDLAGDGIDNDGDGVVDDVNGANFSAVSADGLATVTATNVVTDTSGHGSEVAGIIGGVANNAVTNGNVVTNEAVGVAWHVQLLPVVIFTGADNTATDAAIIAGLNYIRTLKLEGINIAAVNMSFARRYLGPASGIGDAGNIPATTDANGNAVSGGDPPAIQVYSAMDQVTKQGIIIVGAAGNGTVTGTNDDAGAFVPSNYSNGLFISVAASTPDDTLEPISNYGVNTIKIAAPGTLVVTSGLGGAVETVTGSSFATAFVTGAVALIKSFRPNLSSQAIVNLILSSADKIPALTPYVQGGRRLNILNALESLIGNQAPQGSLDSVSGLEYQGWMFDPNVGSGPVTGSVQIDGVPVPIIDVNAGTTGLSFTANITRSDLFQPLGSTDHGFDFRLAALPTPGVHTLQILLNDVVISSTGAFTFNADGSIAITPTVLKTTTVVGGPPGSIDVASGSILKGWLTDQNDVARSTTGILLLDGQQISVLNTPGGNSSTVRASINRPDLATYLGSTNHGFNITWNATLSPGLHLIQLYSISSILDANGNYVLNFDGTRATQSVLVGQETVDGNEPPIGSVDIATTTEIAGWAWDPNSNGVPINVQINIDDTPVAILPANQFHSVRVGTEGYFYTPHFSQGVHRVDVYAIDDFTGDLVLLGTRTVVQNNTLVSTNMAYDNTTRILSGYVVDPDSAFDPVSLQVVIDGTNGERQYLNDIANLPVTPGTEAGFADLITQAGNTNHAFSILLPNVTPGNHQLRVYGYDNETGVPLELFGPPPQNNTLPTGSLTLVSETDIEGNMRDPDSPDNTPTKYRVDIDTSTGEVQTATDLFTDGSVGFDINPPQLTSGAHTVKLYVIDNQSLALTLVDTKTLNVGTLQPNAQPSGQLTNPVSDQAITGFAADTGTTSKFVTVEIIIDGDMMNPLLTATANQPRGGALPANGFSFAQRSITNALFNNYGPGVHYAQVFAIDIDDPTVTTLLGEGEIISHETGVPDWTGDITDLGFIDVNGDAQGAQNDANPLYSISINNAQFTTFTTLPVIPGDEVAFTTPTPLTDDIQGKTVSIKYFDPVTGVLKPIANKRIPVTPVNNFVASRLIATGNQLPAGSLDSASANGIAGWVRDPDVGAPAIMYRLDFDGSIGIPQVADLDRPDLPFSVTDRDHGFSATVPMLTAGAHTVRLYAIDPNTNQVVFIAQRSFTVLDDANKRPIGAVETLDGATVSGYVQDPTTPGAAVSIELDVDGTPVTTVSASTPRTDIPKQNGAFLTGFSFAVPSTVADGIHTLAVYAIDTTDPTRLVLLKSAVVETGVHQIAGVLDVADFTTISGWGRGAANDANPQFRIDVNGIPLETVTGPETVENGITIRRFSILQQPLGVTVSNTVSLYYLDPLTGTAILLASKTIAPLQNMIGNLDLVSSSVIAGWAYSPSAPSASVVIEILVDNVEVAVTTAGLARPDLTDELADHAFQFNTPTLTPGLHQIAVRFRDPVTGDYQAGGTMNLTI